MTETNPQIEADRRLLQYHTYEDYLDSMVTPMDKCLLGNREICRQLVELGYRSSGETLTKQEFEKRRNAVILYLNPSYKPYEMASTGVLLGDNALRELSVRERPNRVGILSTILFLRHVNPTGFEISGYMDFADQLKKRDWKPFFKKQKLMLPNAQDLGYFHWKTDQTRTNDSENYKVIVSPDKGLLFKNRFDRKIVSVAPHSDPGHNTTKKRIFSDLYEHMIIFDHVVRQRI